VKGFFVASATVEIHEAIQPSLTRRKYQTLLSRALKRTAKVIKSLRDKRMRRQTKSFG
jgi:hypothetical protein